jgi:hypothetical protein
VNRNFVNQTAHFSVLKIASPAHRFSTNERMGNTIWHCTCDKWKNGRQITYTISPLSLLATAQNCESAHRILHESPLSDGQDQTTERYNSTQQLKIS